MMLYQGECAPQQIIMRVLNTIEVRGANGSAYNYPQQ
jgi:hypothetical protein